MIDFARGFESVAVGRSSIIHADCLDWLRSMSENSIHAIVTDPPYGHREYEASEIAKRDIGVGGIWRIPPSFDGSVRAPLPRFTALDEKDRAKMLEFFTEWARACVRVMRPGAHAMVASNAFIVPVLLQALIAGGLEFRGQLMREVRTLRGGDRPKGAESEFADCQSLPKGCYEPWALMRKPLPSGMTVSTALRKYATGALRRLPDGPFDDQIESERTPKSERAIASHPSLKPQSLMRLLTYVSLPLGEGVILDPFAGSGSTIAAAEAVGLQAIGIERHRAYFDSAATAVAKLAKLRSKIDATLGITSSPTLFSQTPQIARALSLLPLQGEAA